MATTTGSHPLNAFTTPTTGSALDSSVIRGNFNNVQSAYSAHDSDPGIHLQSGALPAAGTSGRKWVSTTTVGSRVQYRLLMDDGTNWQEITGATFLVSNAQPALFDAGNSGASLAIDWNNGPVQKVTLTDNATLTFSNPVAGGTYTLILVQDGTGGRAVVLGASWDFGENTPTFTTTANKKNVVSGLYDGSEYLAAFGVKGA